MPDAKKYVAERNVRDNLSGEIRQIWDFSVDGGAIGTVNMDVLLPADAIVTSGFIHVLTAVTSGGSGTLSFGLNSNVDMLAATAVASLTANAVIPIVPTNAVPVRLTAERELKATVATAALTAGKVAVYLRFVAPASGVVPVTYRKS